MSEGCCNLEQMSVEELQSLKQTVADILDSKSVDEVEEYKKTDEVEEYKKTDEFKELKKEFKELKKLAKAFTKKREIEVQVPVKFKVNLVDDLECAMNNDTEGLSDLVLGDVFGAQVTGKVTGKFDETVLAVMQDAVSSVCENLCAEVVRLEPGAYEALEGFVERVSDFSKRLAETPLQSHDFE